jgi:hypothetical protein
MTVAGALLELQLPREGLAWSLLLFNTGVEAGQLLVVAPLFPLLLLLRRTPWSGLVQKALSGAALAMALVWLALLTMVSIITLISTIALAVVLRVLVWLISQRVALV